MTDPQESTDVLGAPYTARDAAAAPRRRGRGRRDAGEPAAARPTNRAVLHVHGFADYFFQTVAADWWVERGYDFYALDLRKYGRSLLPHQTPNYVADLATYYEELDAGLAVVAAGHDHVVMSAHSTGGLTVPLWLHDRRPAGLAGVFLNSPWIDMHGHGLLRTARHAGASSGSAPGSRCG